MARNKYQLHVYCECTQLEMKPVCDLKYLFHAANGWFGFWFDSPEERDEAQANIAAAFPAAEFETLDPELPAEPEPEPDEPEPLPEPEPEPTEPTEPSE